MRDYQRKKNNPYMLPTTIYRQVVWIVRDFDRMCDEYDDMIWDSPEPPDGQPRGANIGKPTEREAVKRALLAERINAVEQSLKVVPEKYREAVLLNVQYCKKYPKDYSRNTYGKWRARFLFEIAKKMFFI